MRYVLFSLALALVVLVCAAAASPLALGEAADLPFTITRSGGFPSSTSNQYDVVGEVRNDGTQCYKRIWITARIWWAGGVLRGTESREVFLDHLLPGEESPFWIPVDSVAPSLIDYYTLEVASAIPTHEQPYREVVLQGDYLKSEYWIAGYPDVMGILRNTGDSYLEDVSVYGSFYDSSGNIISVGWCGKMDDWWIAEDCDNVALKHLAPGQYTPFQLQELYRSPHDTEIASYRLFPQVTEMVDRWPLDLERTVTASFWEERWDGGRLYHVYHVEGIVSNYSPVPAEKVSIAVAFYRSDGCLLGWDRGYIGGAGKGGSIPAGDSLEYHRGVWINDESRSQIVSTQAWMTSRSDTTTPPRTLTPTPVSTPTPYPTPEGGWPYATFLPLTVKE